MIHDLMPSFLTSAAVERATLAVNHVLGGEAAATQRLRSHAGRTIECALVGWPALLSPAPLLAFQITPAGLLEWIGAQPSGAAADLRLQIDASNPAGLIVGAMAGVRPSLDVQGDAALASDVAWLIDNVRWDVEDDLARLFGEGLARRLVAVGRPVGHAARAALRTFSGVFDRTGGRSPQ
jgi:ubiquinone biosynthesis protein UbiJ